MLSSFIWWHSQRNSKLWNDMIEQSSHYFPCCVGGTGVSFRPSTEGFHQYQCIFLSLLMWHPSKIYLPVISWEISCLQKELQKEKNSFLVSGLFLQQVSHLFDIDCTVSIIFLPIITFFRCFKRFSVPQWILSGSCWAISWRSRGGTTTCPAGVTAHPLSLVSASRNLINLWSLWSYFGVNSDKSISICGTTARWPFLQPLLLLYQQSDFPVQGLFSLFDDLCSAW